MIPQNIFLFVGKSLEVGRGLTSLNDISRMIKEDESVGINIDEKELLNTLSILIDCGWLEIFKSDSINPIFRRFVTPYELELIRKDRRKAGDSYSSGHNSL